MKHIGINVLTVFLIGMPLFSTSQAFAADDVSNAAESLAKLYKLDSLANEYLFGSFAVTDAQPGASAKFTNNGKKSSSSGFKIRGLKSLQYKVDQNQFFDLKNDGLRYVFKFRF